MSSISFLHDLRHAWRLLVKSPSFTFAAVATLAVALGANTAVFGVVDAVLLRPLPYPEPERLVAVTVALPPIEGMPAREASLDGATLEAWAESSRALEGLAVYQRRDFTVAGGGGAERVAGAGASASLFEVLGVQPAEGRAFHRDDERAGGEPVVLVSQRLRDRRFAGHGALGARLELGGVAHTVIGVMPDGFSFPNEETDLWVPMAATVPVWEGTIQVQFLAAVARLAAGASTTSAAAEGQAVVERGSELGRATPELAAGRVEVTPLAERRVAEVRPALVAMWAAVGLVLVVACFNLANLLLARTASRRRELAVRCAVGGGRRRLVRQLLTENLLLALIGGAAGLVVAAGVHRLLPRLAPAGVPGLDGVVFDVRVFLFALLLAVATACLFGLLPALRSASGRLVQPLHGGVGEASRDRRSQGALVIAEVALSMVLLVGAGLLVRGFLHLVHVELGFAPDGVVTATLDPAAAGIGAAGRRSALFEGLLESMEGEPGVEAAGVVAHPPLSPGFAKMSVGVVGQPPARRLAVPQWTSPGYAEAIGLRLVTGRWLSEADHRSGSSVAVVNESFAHDFLAGLEPLGQRVEVGSSTLEVIGVVEDARLLGFGSEPQPEVFASYRLSESATGSVPNRLTLLVRSAGEPSPLVPLLRSRLAEIEPAVALEDVGLLSGRLSASVATPRFFAVLAGTFAAIGLFLAAAGLYGVLSYSVVSQRRALGVRRALGAQKGDILRLVLGRGAVLVLAGLALGLLGSWWAAELLTGLLSGLPPNDPSSYGVATLIVCAVAFVACYLPARRATRIEPLSVLRAE
jgi:putative ABC transport system permease protein